MDLAACIDFQLSHSLWALRRLLDHARVLPGPAIEQEMGIGPGSLRGNLAHTVEVMFFFADNFSGREYMEPPEFAAGSRTLEGIAGLLEAAAERLRSAMMQAVARGLPTRVIWPNADEGTLPAAAAVTQVFDHAALHRTQCINMLKRLGVRPVPDLDPMSYQATLGGAEAEVK